MTIETKEGRKRRLARERKQRQRDKDKAYKEALGARIIRFEIYRGTDEALDQLKVIEGCDEAEIITLLIHGAYELAQRDMSRFKELRTLKGHAQGGKS